MGISRGEAGGGGCDLREEAWRVRGWEGVAEFEENFLETVLVGEKDEEIGDDEREDCCSCFVVATAGEKRVSVGEAAEFAGVADAEELRLIGSDDVSGLSPSMSTMSSSSTSRAVGIDNRGSARFVARSTLISVKVVTTVITEPFSPSCLSPSSVTPFCLG